MVPSNLTTNGTSIDSSLAAATTPSAMMSHFMIPPKIFTKIAFTFGSCKIIENAFATLSFVAPPPTSKKFAGLPPCNLIMSIVPIANPAPLTMQPI